MTTSKVARIVASLSLIWLASPPISGQEPKSRGERYALLVGVRQYDPNELRGLPYSEADVVELAGVLKEAGYRRVVLMTQTEGARNFRRLPAGANIRNELRGLLEDCEPADTVLIVFAGHGVQFRGEEANYFCPMDAKLADRSTLISLKGVYRDLEGCGAGTKLLLVDACRNDPQSDNARARASVNLESITRPQVSRPPGGIAAFLSCSAGQKAYEHDSLRHGVFFHYVIQGLKGEADLDRDGAIDLEELALFARKRVSAFVKDEFGPDVRQVPVLMGEVAGLAALVGLSRPLAAEPPPIRLRPETTPTGEPELASRMRSLPRPDEPRVLTTITNSIGMRLVLIPAGEFQMGSGDDDHDADDDEKPRHLVRITRPYYLGSTEVTQGEYQAVRGVNPSLFNGADDVPVDRVSWDDAIAFCNALSEREGLKPYYQFGAGAQSGGGGYRLPTEAEWEYACRAGSTTKFSPGEAAESLGEYAWFGANSEAKTHPVGQKRPIAFGLYDMHGNVWEWCWDGYDKDYYAQSPTADPSGPLQATKRVSRGGSWYHLSHVCRAAVRHEFSPSEPDFFRGFRVARASSGP